MNTLDPNAAAAAEDQNDAAADEAAALWAEMDAAEGFASADPAPEEDGTDGTDAEPADEPGDETTTTEEPADDGAQAPADTTTDAPEFDPALLESASPELRAHFDRLEGDRKRLEHEVRSHKGRAVGAQRRYEDLLKAAQPRETPGDRPTPDAALAAIKDDYPEIAGPLSKAFEAVEGKVKDLSEAEEGRRMAAETELNDYLSVEAASLKGTHPDYIEVMQAHFDKLIPWVDDQPKAIREAFARNSEKITNAAEAADVISKFKAFIGTPPVPAANPTPARDARRERQLASTTSPHRAARRPVTSGIPEEGDPQAIWEAIDRLESQRK